MRRIRMPLIATIILCAGFVALVSGTTAMLPERVASHFGASGAPDSWMSKREFLGFTMLFGLGLPLVIAASCSLSMLLPDSVVNIPHKEYWLSPSLRQDTRLYMLSRGLWLSCLTLLMTGSMHCLVIRAHQANPVHLPMAGFGVVMAAFLVSVILWGILLARHFSRP